VADTVSIPPEGRLRARLLEAASALFMERGYAATSTLAIATRAHVSKRDLYLQFPSKQALLAACLADRAQRIRLPSADAVTRSEAELFEALAAFGAALLTAFGHPETLALHRLAVAEAMRSPDLARSVAGAGWPAAAAALRPLLDAAQQARLLGAAPVATIVDDFLALLFGPLPLTMLLRADAPPTAADALGRARHAAQAVLRLYAP